MEILLTASLLCSLSASATNHDFRTWRLTPLSKLREEGLTVMINTYKRPDMLQSAVQHYSKCGVVRSIRVIWCEKGRPPNVRAWDLKVPNRWKLLQGGTSDSGGGGKRGGATLTKGTGTRPRTSGCAFTRHRTR